MIEDEIFVRTDGHGPEGSEKKGAKGFAFLAKIVFVLFLAACLWKSYDALWLRHRYLVTAYCDCPICINVASFRDGKFASQRSVYWGGVAADRSIPFGSTLELVPVTVRDWFAVKAYLGDRRRFTVEDRGGKINDRHIDIFFPQSMGGHEIARQWGVRRMRVKINGRLMD